MKHDRNRGLPRRVARPVTAVLLAGLVAIAALGLTAAPASAIPAGYLAHTTFTANGVNIRSGPGTGYTVVGSGFYGQKWCFDGSSGSWVHGRNLNTGKAGWVNQAYINLSGKFVIVRGRC